MRWQTAISSGAVMVLVLACARGSTLTRSELAGWRELSALQEPANTSPRICRVHHQRLEETAVPGYGGFAVMPRDEYVRARLASFPHAWLFVNTGWCEADVRELRDAVLVPLLPSRGVGMAAEPRV